MTLTIDEGKQLIGAVNASGRVFQVGTQQRSFRLFQQACELVQNGRLGNLQQIDVFVPQNRNGGPFASQPLPESLDWDRWLGPAPETPFCDQRFEGYRFWYEYSGGTMTDWGAHNVDIAQWAMQQDQSGPVKIDSEAKFSNIENGYNMPIDFHVELKYANGVTVRVLPSSTDQGILFQGDEGRIYVNRRRLTGKPAEDLARNPLPADAVRCGSPRSRLFASYNMSHLMQFFDCILTGKKPVSDVESQHRSSSACHLANISMRLGKKIVWDPLRQGVVGDMQANAMLSRPSRSV
jgi:predicted dehydrogenase